MRVVCRGGARVFARRGRGRARVGLRVFGMTLRATRTLLELGSAECRWPDQTWAGVMRPPGRDRAWVGLRVIGMTLRTTRTLLELGSAECRLPDQTWAGVMSPPSRAMGRPLGRDLA